MLLDSKKIIMYIIILSIQIANFRVLKISRDFSLTNLLLVFYIYLNGTTPTVFNLLSHHTSAIHKKNSLI